MSPRAERAEVAISYRFWMRSSDIIWSCGIDGLNDRWRNMSLVAGLRLRMTSVVTKQPASELLTRGLWSSYRFDIFYCKWMYWLQTMRGLPTSNRLKSKQALKCSFKKVVCTNSTTSACVYSRYNILFKLMCEGKTGRGETSSEKACACVNSFRAFLSVLLYDCGSCVASCKL